MRNNIKLSQLGESVFIFLLSVFVLSPAYAEELKFEQFGWKIKTSNEVKKLMAATKKRSQTNTKAKAEYEAYLNILSWAPKEMSEIGEWMASMKYPQTGMWRKTNKNNWISQGKPKGTANFVLGSKYAGTYDTRRGEIDIYTGVLLDDVKVPQIEKTENGNDIYKRNDLLNHSGTFAHEIFHGVHREIDPSFEDLDDTYDWIVEGIPTAVEFAWTEKKYGGSVTTIEKIPKYDESLFAPKNGYSRGHFFWKLGDHLKEIQNSKYKKKMKHGTMRYVKELLKTKVTQDEMKGAKWLDAFLSKFQFLGYEGTGDLGPGLAIAYSNIVSNYSYTDSKNKYYKKCRLVNIDEKISNLTIILDDIKKIASSCFRVKINGSFAKGAIEISTTAKTEVIYSIYSIGAQLNTKVPTILKTISFPNINTTTADSSKASWKFLGVPTNKEITFILSNVARDISKTVKIRKIALKISLSSSTGDVTYDE